jgi:hypothetical protein
LCQGVIRNADAVKEADDDYLLQTWTLLPMIEQLIARKGHCNGQSCIAVICSARSGRQIGCEKAA